MTSARPSRLAPAILVLVILFGGAAWARDPDAGATCQAPADPPEDLLQDGNALLERGEPAAAAEAYRQASRAARADGDSMRALQAEANAARAAVEAGEPRGVPQELERIAAASRAGGAGDHARLLIHLGRTAGLRAADEPRDTRALAVASALLSEAERETAGRARLRSYALGFRGELYERRGRLEEAMALTRKALLAGLEADAPDAIYRWQWQAARIHAAAGRTDRAISEYREAAGTLAALRRHAGAGFRGQEAPSGAPIEDLYLELVDLLLQQAARAPDPAARQALLVEARDALEAQKAEEITDYFRDECLAAQRKATPDEVPGTVFIYPVALRDRLELLVGGMGPLERFAVPVGREQLAREVGAFRAKLTRRTTREYQAHGHRLHEWLVAPIAPLLQARAPDTLVFVPDGALRTIPFASLQDPESDEFLIERYPLAIVPSLTLTEPRPLQDVSVRMLTAGLSESVEGFPALTFVPDEIDAVKATFPGRSIMNEDFVATRFEEEVETRPFGIVHIASHAEFGGDPSESFLLAFDGRLPMNRLARTVGTTRFRRDQPLELLTLSACETAVGNERAGLGLAGIALQAGARSALASLWSVNDQASTQLIGEFYAKLQQDASRAEALQQAQIALLGHRGFRHPAFWSSFVLISSWL
jgi:CHAT domain-containing protein